ncbi:SEC-C metal-binding domain-containing protein [Cohnella suwonensis]|uniref:SEC-C metal-binding domain-containing protein n=1 Tax=Cohnella suwonensis TaxID=696072 RepID=A0ABW0M0F2_9BACL
MQKLGRNDPCHCGSGLKYKKCCLSKDEASHVARVVQLQPKSIVDIIDREFAWPNELHRLIAKHFYKQTDGLYDPEEILEILQIWNDYANETVPIVKKIGVYPAALEYVLCQEYGYETTQSELADKYNISVTTLSQRSNQIFEFMSDYIVLPPNAKPNAAVAVNASSPSRIKMEQEMQNLHALLEEQNFSTMEEANAFLQQQLNKKPPKRKALSPAEQATELLYAAWDEPNAQRRIKLAQDALRLDPNSVDAYNILADSASATPKEKAFYYRQGMAAGEKTLGESFFKENKGHFWGYVPTRPYMRAKKGYAETCAEMGNIPEAIKHYRELLELNPNDNQGVRDLLLPAYIETMEWKNAAALIKQYDDDGSATFSYGRILVEFGLNGQSVKLSELIKKATGRNPYVPAYLQGKKQLPRELPEYIGFGDDQEAIFYALLNRHLWMVRPELLQLLPVGRK